MRAGGTLAVSSIWTNLIDCCKPILARRRNRRGPTALQGVSTWIHGDAAVCHFLRSQNSMPRSTRKYTHCCRTAPIPQQGTSSQVGARCCVDGVPTHRRQDAVPALCPKVDAFTPDSGNTLLVGERKGRITPEQTKAFFDTLRVLSSAAIIKTRVWASFNQLAMRSPY